MNGGFGSSFIIARIVAHNDQLQIVQELCLFFGLGIATLYDAFNGCAGRGVGLCNCAVIASLQFHLHLSTWTQPAVSIACNF